MGIGTSQGAYYDDAFHESTAQWDPKYDDNITIPKSTGDINDIDPTKMMTNKIVGQDPNNIYNDQGNIVDYSSPGPLKTFNETIPRIEKDDTLEKLDPLPLLQQQSMKSPMPFPDNNNPDSDFNSRFPKDMKSGIMNDLKPKIEDKPLLRKISYDTDWPAPPEEQEGTRDFTNDYNTPIDEKGMKDYYKWVGSTSAKVGRDIEKDTEDYDMQGAFKAGIAPSDANGHWPDTYKKPNHPTFSDQSIYHGASHAWTGEDPNKLDKWEGGHWDKDDAGRDTFTPGSTNLLYRGPQELIDYFKKYEPKSKLILPSQ